MKRGGLGTSELVQDSSTITHLKQHTVTLIQTT